MLPHSPHTRERLYRPRAGAAGFTSAQQPSQPCTASSSAARSPWVRRTNSIVDVTNPLPCSGKVVGHLIPPIWCRREELNPDRPDTNGLLDH